MGKNGVATIYDENRPRHFDESNDDTDEYEEYQGYQEYDQDEDQEQEDCGKRDDFEAGEDQDGKGVVSPSTPPSPFLGLSEQPFYQISPFGFQSRGRFYQSHSAITEVSERTSCADCSLRKVSNGSSHASDGSANSDSNNSSGNAGDGGIFSTPSTPPKDKDSAWVKTTGLLTGDVSDDEDINAGAISPRTFLKLAEGCSTNRAFRVGGPAKVSFPIVSFFSVVFSSPSHTNTRKPGC